MCAQRSSLLHYGSVSKLCRTARSSRSVRHDIHGIRGVHGTAFTECMARHSQSAQHWVCVSGGSHTVGVSEFHSVRLKTMKFNWLYLVILEQANRSRCTAKWREHWQTDTDTPVGTSQTTQPATQLVNVYDTCVCVCQIGDRQSIRPVKSHAWANLSGYLNTCISALEALRNALYKCSTYLLTYLLNTCMW